MEAEVFALSATDAAGDRVKDFFSVPEVRAVTLLDGQRVAAVPNWLGEARTTSRLASREQLCGRAGNFAPVERR